jgi:DinB superfamily
MLAHQLWRIRNVIDGFDPATSGHLIARLSGMSLKQKIPAAALSLLGPIAGLAQLVAGTVEHIDAFSGAYGQQRLKRKPWSRKEAVGHLIDWAIVHRRWFVRALTEPKVVARGYPQDEWVSAQQYGAFPWPELVALWLGENRLLVHVLRQIPEEKLNTPCRIGIDKPIPLAQVIDRYVAHCEDLVGQILARL